MINEILRVGNFVLQALLKVWPLLLITIPLAIWLQNIGVSKRINSILSKNIYMSILIATLVGAVAPFCSCSVIPVISSMLIAGVPLAPVMGFWLASPSMDPEVFFLSVASLGYPLAIARLAVTFIMSFSGGVIAHKLIGGIDQDKLLKMVKKGKKKSADLDSENASSCDSTSCSDEEEESCGCGVQTKLQTYLHSAITSVWFVLKFLVIAFTLEALIIFYLPEEFVLVLFGGGDVVSVMKATALGIPLYTTNISALGIIGGLLEKGLNDGAALAFLVGGATTTIPAMSAVYNLVHKKVFAIYLSVAIGFSLVSGILFNLIAKFI